MWWKSTLCLWRYVGNTFPEIACSLTDPRVEIYHEDGLRFIRCKTDEYDLIIIDSPNPFGPGEGLFTKEFYGNCYNALQEDGIMINQNESPFLCGRSVPVPEDAQADRGDIPDLPGIPGTYSVLSFRSLAVRLCVQEIPSVR